MNGDEIIASLDNGVGRLRLHRPAALNALTRGMCEALIRHLELWRHDDAVRLVIIDHAAGKGFCAGGDIRMLAHSGAGDGRDARDFFRTEYQLNALLMAYPKATVAVMDGMVMGGGVGLALPCRRRIATERTTFAMPETGIGLFPDVGGGWHLPRLPGETGLWLALTGARLRAADCLALGIATDYVPADRLDELAAALTAAPVDADAALRRLAEDPGPPPLAPHRALIDRIFALDGVEAIMKALNADSDPFAAEQGAVLSKKSPQTLKVAFRQLRTGRTLSTFAENMAMEFRIGSRVVARHDFQEGVRAVIIDKDQAPQWRPDRLEDVTDALLDAIFAPLPPEEEWRPLEASP